jgi:hypothetical protein
MKIVNKIKSITKEDVMDWFVDVFAWTVDEFMSLVRDVKSTHLVYPKVLYVALVLILIAWFV